MLGREHAGDAPQSCISLLLAGPLLFWCMCISGWIWISLHMQVDLVAADDAATPAGTCVDCPLMWKER